MNVPHVALVPIQTSSPERRITQKEIIAGEERPKYLLIKQHQDSATGNIQTIQIHITTFTILFFYPYFIFAYFFY